MEPSRLPSLPGAMESYTTQYSHIFIYPQNISINNWKNSYSKWPMKVTVLSIILSFYSFSVVYFCLCCFLGFCALFKKKFSTFFFALYKNCIYIIIIIKMLYLTYLAQLAVLFEEKSNTLSLFLCHVPVGHYPVTHVNNQGTIFNFSCGSKLWTC